VPEFTDLRPAFLSIFLKLFTPVRLIEYLIILCMSSDWAKMAPKSSELPTIGLSKKRKRGATTRDKTNEPQKITKKQRTASEDDDLDLSMGINKSFALMDSRLLADYMAQMTRKFENDLSSVELEDRYIPGNNFMPSLLATLS
jgi:hypothetical protein